MQPAPGCLDFACMDFSCAGYVIVKYVFQWSFVHQGFLMYGCNDEQSSEKCSASKGKRHVRISKVMTFETIH